MPQSVDTCVVRGVTGVMRYQERVMQLQEDVMP
jgi:hypothetical protein